jgi:hypothetical protein
MFCVHSECASPCASCPLSPFPYEARVRKPEPDKNRNEGCVRTGTSSTDRNMNAKKGSVIHIRAYLVKCRLQIAVARFGALEGGHNRGARGHRELRGQPGDERGRLQQGTRDPEVLTKWRKGHRRSARVSNSPTISLRASTWGLRQMRGGE